MNKGAEETEFVRSITVVSPGGSYRYLVAVLDAGFAHCHVMALACLNADKGSCREAVLYGEFFCDYLKGKGSFIVFVGGVNCRLSIDDYKVAALICANQYGFW